MARFGRQLEPSRLLFLPWRVSYLEGWLQSDFDHYWNCEVRVLGGFSHNGLCVQVCECMCACVFVHVSVCACAHVHVFMRACVSVRGCVCECVCACVRARARARVCMRVRTSHSAGSSVMYAP